MVDKIHGRATLHKFKDCFSEGTVNQVDRTLILIIEPSFFGVHT